MSHTVALKVGPSINADGAENEIRGNKDGCLITLEGHSRFQEAVYRGNVYVAALQAATAVTALASAATGLIVSNPANSGKNLVLWELGVAQAIAGTTAICQISLAANVNPIAAATVHTTAGVVRNCLLGAANSAVGLFDTAATLPVAPVIVRAVWSPSVSATATTAIPPVIVDHIDGALIVTPGCAVSLSASTAMTVIAHLIWEEIAI